MTKSRLTKNEQEKKGTKRKLSKPSDNSHTKRTHTDNDDDCVVTSIRHGEMRGSWPELRYHQVNEEWQRYMCGILGLNFVSGNGLGGGGPDIILTRPLAVKRIRGDGNCLFRCLSFVVTGSQEQHYEVRRKICSHLIAIGHLMLFQHMHAQCTS